MENPGCGGTQAVALDVSKAFDRVWHTGYIQKLKSYGISGQIFGFISSFLCNGCHWVVLNGKSSQEYPVNVGVAQMSILGPTLSCYTLMNFLVSVILLSMLMILSTLNVIGDLTSGSN